MPRDITATLVQQSRRLISNIVNIGDTVCCKKWKRKTNKCQPQLVKVEKVLDCQDEVKEILDSFTPESIADITIAEAIPSKITIEPDWVKRFFEVKEVEENRDEIFQSEDEDDEDPNKLIKEPCPLPFEESKIDDLYNARAEKNPRPQQQSRGGNPRFRKYLYLRDIALNIGLICLFMGTSRAETRI